jgi:hypothetical protein
MTRAKMRDKESDELRISSIRAAVRSAIESSEAELEGLGRRIDNVSARASFAFDRADSDRSTREATDELMISTLETSLVAALQRQFQLKENLSNLRGLELIIVTKFQKQT